MLQFLDVKWCKRIESSKQSYAVIICSYSHWFPHIFFHHCMLLVGKKSIHHRSSPSDSPCGSTARARSLLKRSSSKGFPSNQLVAEPQSTLPGDAPRMTKAPAEWMSHIGCAPFNMLQCPTGTEKLQKWTTGFLGFGKIPNLYNRNRNKL